MIRFAKIKPKVKYFENKIYIDK